MTELARNITGGSVYVLFDKDEVVYVGQSKNPCSRIASHNKDKIFTAYLIMQCKPKRMLYWESVLIAGYGKPKYNKTCPKKGGNVVPIRPKPEPIKIKPSDGRLVFPYTATTTSCDSMSLKISSRQEWEKSLRLICTNTAASSTKIQEPDRKAIVWAERNPWFGKDHSKTIEALHIHSEMIYAGIDSGSDEYYQELDRRVEEFENKMQLVCTPNN